MKFDYPIEKYRFYTDNKRKVIAVSTYAGKTVRGVAMCDPKDEFSFEKGKQLAAARCAMKIADKRAIRAEDKLDEAYLMVDEAIEYRNRMVEYYDDAMEALKIAIDNTRAIEKSL